jgi:hypothetical protein
MLIEAPYLMEDDWVFASPASKGQLDLLVLVHLRVHIKPALTFQRGAENRSANANRINGQFCHATIPKSVSFDIASLPLTPSNTAYRFGQRASFVRVKHLASGQQVGVLSNSR